MSTPKPSLKMFASLLLIAGSLIALSSCRKSAATNSTGTDAVSVIKSGKPLAYYRLETTSGSSEIGSSTYKFVDGVTNSSGAPIGIAGNKGALLNGKDGWISTTQKGGITNAGSMMAWINLATTPKDAGRILYIGGESENGNDFDLQFEGDNEVRFYTAAGSHLTYKPDPQSLVNQWHMVVATFDVTGHSRTIYWDGQQVATDQDAGQPNKTAPFSMGESTVFRGRFFPGDIDEVAVWDRSLSASEVAAIYKAAK